MPEYDYGDYQLPTDEVGQDYNYYNEEDLMDDDEVQNEAVIRERAKKRRWESAKMTGKPKMAKE